MELPRGLGRVRVGTIPAEPLATAAGDVRVEAKGIIFDSPWLHVRWLRPVSVTVERDGTMGSAMPIRDVTRNAVLSLALAGVIVAVVFESIRQKWGRS